MFTATKIDELANLISKNRTLSAIRSKDTALKPTPPLYKLSQIAQTRIKVGGEGGWNSRVDLELWASSTKFFVGDSLVFVYQPLHDVSEVNKSSFYRCDSRDPLNITDVGETVVFLSQVGVWYFLCCWSNYCSLGMRIRVPVVERPSTQVSRPKTGPSEKYVLIIVAAMILGIVISIIIAWLRLKRGPGSSREGMGLEMGSRDNRGPERNVVHTAGGETWGKDESDWEDV